MAASTLVSRPEGESMDREEEPTKMLPEASTAMPAAPEMSTGVPSGKHTVLTVPEKDTERMRPLPESATTRLLLRFTAMPAGRLKAAAAPAPSVEAAAPLPATAETAPAAETL
jgi:hypothetical protein